MAQASVKPSEFDGRKFCDRNGWTGDTDKKISGMSEKDGTCAITYPDAWLKPSAADAPDVPPTKPQASIDRVKAGTGLATDFQNILKWRALVERW